VNEMSMEYDLCDYCQLAHGKCSYRARYTEARLMIIDLYNHIKYTKVVDHNKPFTKPKEKYNPVNIRVWCDFYKEVPEKEQDNE
jgi:hypothetical protein